MWTPVSLIPPASPWSLRLFSLPAAPFLLTVPEEESLLARLRQSEISECFTVLERLDTLYTRNAKQGGLEGKRWLGGAREVLHRHIQNDDLYGRFLREEEGRSVLRLPPCLPRPPVLRLGGDGTAASVIHLPYQRIPATGALGYFRIEHLMPGQEILSVRKIALFEDLVRRKSRMTPVIVARDLRLEESFHVHDGHHRSFAALRGGFGYILGQMNREPRLSRVRADWCAMTLLSHEEFLERTEPNRTMGFPDADLEGSL